MAAPQYPLDWEEILAEYTDEDNLDLYGKDVEEQGEEIHEWLENELDDYEELRFEQVTSWENEEGETEWGRYDARDDYFIYEFKSKPRVHGFLLHTRRYRLDPEAGRVSGSAGQPNPDHHPYRVLGSVCRRSPLAYPESVQGFSGHH